MKWQSIKTYSDLYKLSETDLQDYIKDRLQLIPENIFPPIVTTKEEEPEDFIINAFKSIEDVGVLEKFYNAVTSLTYNQWEIAKASSNHIDGEYFSHLIYLIEYFRIRKSHDPIYFFAVNSNYLINTSGYYTDKVYEQVLRALASLQEGPPGYILLWKKILKDPQLQEFAQAAFTGLRFCGLDYALEALSDYAEIASKKDNYIIKLGNSLVSLIRQYGNANIETIIQKIVESVVEKRWWFERRTVLEALSLSPKINQDYRQLLIPLLPWGWLKALPEAIDPRKSLQTSLPDFKILDYAKLGIGNIINNLINTLHDNPAKNPEESIETINQFLDIFDTVPQLKESAIGKRINSLAILDKLSHILSDTEIVTEIKRRGERELSKRLLQTKDSCLSLLEEIKGELTTKVARITNRLSKAVLADMLGSDQDVIQWINEVKEQDPESVPESEWSNVSSYIQFSVLGDFYRLLSKTGLSENILHDFEEAERLYKKALLISDDEGKPLLWSRLSELLLLYGKYFFDKNSYNDVIYYAEQAIKVSEEWLEWQKKGKRYSINLRLSDAYFLKAQACEAQGQQDAAKYFDLTANACQGAIDENPHDFIGYSKLVDLHLTKGNILDAVRILDRFRAIQRPFEEKEGRLKRSSESIEYEAAALLTDYGFPENSGNRLLSLLTKTQPDNIKAAILLSDLLNEVLDIDIARKFATQFIESLDPMTLTSAQSIVIFSVKSWFPEWRNIEEILQKYSGTYAQEAFAQHYFELARSEMSGSESQQDFLTKASNYNKKLEILYKDYSDKIVWTRRSRIELLQGNVSKAIDLLETLYGKFQEDEYIPFHLGECYQKQGDYQKALEYYQKAYNLMPLIDSADRIAFCQFKLGNLKGSLDIFRRIVEENPMDATAINAMGMVFFELGDKLQAADQWVEALRVRTTSLLEEGITGRSLHQAKRTANAMVSLLNGNDQLKEKILSTLHNENPYLATLLVDQLTAISFFKRNVADRVLNIINLQRPMRLKRRVAQYCMGRAIFLSLGLVSDEEPKEWIKRVISLLSKISNDLVAEFLAGAKGSYEKALRKFATVRQLQSFSGLEQILSDFEPPQSKWNEFFTHISSSVANPDYYKRAEELVSSLVNNGVEDYATYQIKELSKKIVRDIGLHQQLRELQKYLLKEEKQLSDKDIVGKLEKGLELLALFPSAIKLWQVNSFQKEMEDGDGRFQMDVDRKEWEQIQRHPIWVDGESLAQLGRWCFEVVTSNGKGDSKKPKVKVTWKLGNDSSVSCIFKTDKHIDHWPLEVDRLLVANSAAKLERSDGIGFVLLPTSTYSEISSSISDSVH